MRNRREHIPRKISRILLLNTEHNEHDNSIAPESEEKLEKCHQHSLQITLYDDLQYRRQWKGYTTYYDDSSSSNAEK